MSDNAERKKILLIDDDDVYLAITVAMLSDDYDVTTVKSGKDALFLFIRKYKPDLILLDIMMPEMDGWETFNKLRGISLLRRVPIAFLTCLKNEDEIKRSREIGATDFITKPSDKSELLGRIKKILEAHADSCN